MGGNPLGGGPNPEPVEAPYCCCGCWGRYCGFIFNSQICNQSSPPLNTALQTIMKILHKNEKNHQP
jgi:hypothetical protein